MAKDYRNKKPQPKKAKSSSLFMPVLLSFLFGYLCASLFDFHQLTKLASEYISAKNTPKTVSSDKKTAVLPKPKFEFYSLLTSEHQSTGAPVVAAKPITGQTSGAKINSSAADESSKSAYWLQVASFKDLQDADRLKASLLLKGYDATISTASTTKSKWYRVNIGPYPSMPQVEKAQVAIIKSEKVMGIIRKMEG